MKKQPTLIEMIQQEVHLELRKIRRQQKKFKMKVLITLVFPAVILLLTIKVIQVYTRVHLKSLLSPNKPKQPSAPASVKAHVSKPEFITPEKVETPIIHTPVVSKSPAVEAAQEIIITEITEDM